MSDTRYISDTNEQIDQNTEIKVLQDLRGFDALQEKYEEQQKRMEHYTNKCANKESTINDLDKSLTD